MENFGSYKTPQNLERNVKIAEWVLEKEIVGENERATLLSLSREELKEKYPERYENYLTALRTGAVEIRKKFGREYLPSEYSEFCKRLGLDPNRIKRESIPTPTRRRAMKLIDGSTSYIVKSLESPLEKDIASAAGSLGIGPKQYVAMADDLIEEFIEGTPLLSLAPQVCTPDFMKNLGIQCAKNMQTLHQHDILINDQILTDDFGKSHTIIDREGKFRLVDFGASIELASYPELSDEAVFSLMRTDPFMAFQARNIFEQPHEVQQQTLAKYRAHIVEQYPTKQSLLTGRDYQLLNEGLSFLSMRLPNVQSFFAGVREELQRDSSQ